MTEKHKCNFKIFKKADRCKIKLKEIPKKDYAIFDVDGEEIIVKKNHRGKTEFYCTCTFCGREGIASLVFCRRKHALSKYLTEKKGKLR